MTKEGVRWLPTAGQQGGATSLVTRRGSTHAPATNSEPSATEIDLRRAEQRR